MLNRRLAGLRGSLLATLGLSLAGGCGGDAEENGPRGGAGGQGGELSGGGPQGGALQGGKSGAGSGAGGTGPTTVVCSSATEPSHGYARCSDFAMHRPAKLACPLEVEVPAANGGTSGGGGGGAGGENPYGCGPCDEDSYGRCFPGESESYCLYGCRVDEDCEGSQICLCNGDNNPGVCSYATCATDEDCTEEGELCLGTGHPNSCTGLPDFEFHCRKPSATVAGPDDAVCGRPFLIDGEPCLAELTRAPGWSSAVFANQDLLPNQRAALTEHWGKLALMEHASVAAFARFLLELLTLGAPAELVQEAQRALGDEIAHAELCFNLASRYAGQQLGPSALDTAGALAATSRVECVVRAFEEACVGETLAVADAAAALDAASDPQVRAALSRIVEDEARHAELGYRFVAWAMQSCSVTEKEQLQTQLRQALTRTLESATEPCTRSGALEETVERAHGLLSQRDRRGARRAALSEVVLPCAHALGIFAEAPVTRAA